MLSPEIPVAASQWYLDCPEPPNHPKSQTCAVQAKLPWFPDGKWNTVNHVPGVCASGRGNTSSRTPLIIFVFGEFAAAISVEVFEADHRFWKGKLGMLNRSFQCSKVLKTTETFCEGVIPSSDNVSPCALLPESIFFEEKLRKGSTMSSI